MLGEVRETTVFAYPKITLDRDDYGLGLTGCCNGGARYGLSEVTPQTAKSLLTMLVIGGVALSALALLGRRRTYY